MRRIFAPLFSLLLLFNLSTPVHAGDAPWFFASSAIDGDGDREFDLSTCWGADGQSLYSWRGTILDWLRQELGDAVESDEGSVGGQDYEAGFRSNGACDPNDNANIWVVMASMGGGTCSIYGSTTDMSNNVPGSHSHTQLKIRLNSNCTWDWNYLDGVSAGQLDAASVITHEALHAWGLGHSGYDGALMYDGGPTHCSFYGNHVYMSLNDATAQRGRYTGLDDAPVVFFNPAMCGS